MSIGPALALVLALGVPPPPGGGFGEDSDRPPPPVALSGARSVSVRDAEGRIQRLTNIPGTSAFARHGGGAAATCSFTADRDGFELSDGTTVEAGAVVAEGLDDPPGDRADPVDHRVGGRRSCTDWYAWLGEVAEDDGDRRGTGCDGPPGEQRTGPDPGTEQEHDDRVHESAPVSDGLEERVVNRSGSSMWAMRVSSQPPVAKIAPTKARTIWPPGLS